MHLFKTLFCACGLFFLATAPAFSQQANRLKRAIDLAAENAFSKNIRSDAQTIFLKKSKKAGLIESLPVALPFVKPDPFTAFSVVMETVAGSSDGLEIWLSKKTDGQKWSPWQLLKTDDHAEPGSLRQPLELLYLEPDVTRVKLRAAFSKGSKAKLKNLELHFFNPGGNGIGSSLPQFQPGGSGNENGACPCPQPAFLTRSQWCGSGCQPTGTLSTTTVTHLIVHHAAGANTSSNWSAVVSAIWDFHVNTNGWTDIGYNWLIAPDGTVFQGRGDNIIGSHFCGKNAGTMGVCMLGNFQTAQPSAAALQKLKDLLAWKSCSTDLNPTGSAFHSSSGLTLKNISGHQDGCSTDCPGANLYPLLPSIRTDVATIITNCGNTPPPVLAPANDKCFNAISLNSTTNCSPTSGTVTAATPSSSNIEPNNGGKATCDNYSGTPKLNDVWYKFQATHEKHTITVDPSGSGSTALDAVLAVYDGACADNLTAIACADEPGGGGTTTALTYSNFMVGKIYLIRLYDWGNTDPANGDFQICVTHQDCSVANNGQTAITVDACTVFGNFQLSTASGCPYLLSATGGGWLTVDNPSGTGSGNINFTMEGNTSSSLQQASIITSTGATLLSVTQNGCDYSLGSNSQNVSFNGGSFSFGLQTCATCFWTASEDCDWVILNQSNGQGGQPISVQVQNNPTTSSRQCVISFGNGLNFTITQEPATVKTTEAEWTGQLLFFPNPTDGLAQLTGVSPKNTGLKWALTDALGRMVLGSEARISAAAFSLPFDFSGIPSGNYILVLTDEAGFRKAVRVAIL